MDLDGDELSEMRDSSDPEADEALPIPSSALDSSTQLSILPSSLSSLWPLPPASAHDDAPRNLLDVGPVVMQVCFKVFTANVSEFCVSLFRPTILS